MGTLFSRKGKGKKGLVTFQLDFYVLKLIDAIFVTSIVITYVVVTSIVSLA